MKLSIWVAALPYLPVGALAGGALYSDEANLRGLDHFTHYGDWNEGFGAGVVFADIDDDGDPDVVVTGGQMAIIRLFENDGLGFFTDRTLGCGVAPLIPTSGVVAADYDGDRDLDLFFTTWAQGNRLYRNEGDFNFIDVSQEAGLADDGPGHGACFADIDGDGWLDLYVANRNYPQGALGGPPNRFYRNGGDGVFEEVGGVHGIDDAGASFQPAFFDFDLDGNLDLYVANDKGTPAYPNRLWRYERASSTFVDVSASSGANVIGDFMGVAVGDFDRNGYPDIYTTNIPTGNALLLNQGTGVFVEAAAEAGVAAYVSGWGALFLDYDLDGDEDLYVATSLTPNMLFRYDGAWPAVEVAAEVGLDVPGNSFCIAAADLEGDGDLDILVQNFQDDIRLMVNHIDQHADPHNHLTVRLVGTGGNLHGVGARAEIAIDGTRQMRQLLSGVGYKSSSAQSLHFGVGHAAVVDELTIYWPDGAEQTFEDIPTNQTFHAFADGAVPALGGPALVGLGVVLAGVGCVVIRRRHASSRPAHPNP